MKLDRTAPARSFEAKAPRVKKYRLNEGWTPRWYQSDVWQEMQNGRKRVVMCCHRRWGKDDVSLRRLAVAAHERVGNYWYMLPEYAQGRKAIWTAVNPHSGKRRIDEAFPEELRKRTDNQSMFIELDIGSTIQVVGSDAYNSLVGSPPLGVVGSEWALADPASWAYLMPVLEENGGWAYFPYTPRGRNHGLDFYNLSQSGDPDWYGELQGVDYTEALSKDQLAKIRAQYRILYGEEDGDNLFEQEYMVSFDAAILGAYYAKAIATAERNKRVVSLPYSTEHQVHTGWDLGIDDATAIWFFQEVGRETWVIDYYEARNRSGSDIAADLGKFPYVYGTHYLPHDADQREKTSAKTYAETMRSLLRGDVIACDKTGPTQRIHATRQFLPRCLFARSANVDKGLGALRSYKVDFDTKTRTPKKTPKHDWASHPADAFGTYAENRAQSPMRANIIGAGTYDNPIEHGEDQGRIHVHRSADPKSGFRPSDSWAGWDQREYFGTSGVHLDDE